MIALPYAAYTMGDSRANLSLSAGYGLFRLDGDSGGSVMFSVGGLRKLGRTGTFVMDSLMFYSRWSDSGPRSTLTNQG
jgi:hypothetical protein